MASEWALKQRDIQPRDRVFDSVRPSARREIRRNDRARAAAHRRARVLARRASK